MLHPFLAQVVFVFFFADDTLFAMAAAAVFAVMGLKGWDTPGVRQSCTGAFDPRAPRALGETPGQWKARGDATIKKRQERANEDKIHHEKDLLKADVKLWLETSKMYYSWRNAERMRRLTEETEFKRRIKGLNTKARNLKAKAQATIDKKSDEIRKLKAKVRELKKKAAAA